MVFTPRKVSYFFCLNWHYFYFSFFFSRFSRYTWTLVLVLCHITVYHGFCKTRFLACEWDKHLRLENVLILNFSKGNAGAYDHIGTVRG